MIVIALIVSVPILNGRYDLRYVGGIRICVETFLQYPRLTGRTPPRDDLLIAFLAFETTSERLRKLGVAVVSRAWPAICNVL
jgi:hypothetical protein